MNFSAGTYQVLLQWPENKFIHKMDIDEGVTVNLQIKDDMKNRRSNTCRLGRIPSKGFLGRLGPSPDAQS